MQHSFPDLLSNRLTSGNLVTNLRGEGSMLLFAPEMVVDKHKRVRCELQEKYLTDFLRSEYSIF